MKCFLHIGTEKTATTTIQNFFDENRGALLRKGFIYTKSAGKTNNRALSVAAYNPERRDDYTKLHYIRSNLDLARSQKNIIRKLEKEIESYREYSDTIIFSSEHFQSRLTTIEEIERLKSILDKLGMTKIYVVIYLRRPAEIANSLFSTAIKSGATLEFPPRPNDAYFNNICNHKKTIEKFSSVFGENSVIPKLFDKKEFTNGSIIDDILKTIGIPKDPSYTVPEDANESLSSLGVNLLRHLNKTIPILADGSPPHRRNITALIEKHFSDSKYIMPSWLYEEYDLEFSNSNNWVRDKYFPDKFHIFTNHIPIETKSSISDSDIENIANVITDIWHNSQKKAARPDEFPYRLYRGAKLIKHLITSKN